MAAIQHDNSMRIKSAEYVYLIFIGRYFIYFKPKNNMNSPSQISEYANTPEILMEFVLISLKQFSIRNMNKITSHVWSFLFILIFNDFMRFLRPINGVYFLTNAISSPTGERILCEHCFKSCLAFSPA